MPSGAEVVQALYGTWRFARLDRSAMRFFDLSHSGVWRSFWGPAICYPLFVVLLLDRLDSDTIAQSGFLHILIVETIGYVTGVVAFPLIVLSFCRWLGREDEGFDFIVVYNWSQVLQTALFVLVAMIIRPIFPAEVAPDIDLLADATILAYEWFIALIAIGAGGWIAFAIVLIDVALGTTLLLVAQSLY